MRNLSYENEFGLHENEPVEGKHFHMKGIAKDVFLTEAIAHCRNVRGLGKSMVVFGLFEKLRY